MTSRVGKLHVSPVLLHAQFWLKKQKHCYENVSPDSQITEPIPAYIVFPEEDKTCRFLSECMKYLFSATLQMNVVFFFLRCLLQCLRRLTAYYACYSSMIFYMKATEPHYALLVFSKCDLHADFVLC